MYTCLRVSTTCWSTTSICPERFEWNKKMLIFLALRHSWHFLSKASENTLASWVQHIRICSHAWSNDKLINYTHTHTHTHCGAQITVYLPLYKSVFFHSRYSNVHSHLLSPYFLWKNMCCVWTMFRKHKININILDST